MGMRQPSPPPQDNPQEESQEQPSPTSGGISKLVAGIYSQLTQLMDSLSQASQSQPDVVSPDDIQQLTSIIKAYQQFVSETLGSAPGGPSGKPKPAPGPNQVNPMQGSQPSSNVKPVGY